MDLAYLARQCGASLILSSDRNYPEALNDLQHKPDRLFARGSIDTLARTRVAIVGTRTCTRYGERVATELGAELAAAGACIVSGLARGIDSAAHRGALSVGGYTCAVLGTGIDLVYPVDNASLQKEIGEKGLLLTEMLPGERAYKSSFVKRNRIIAALSQLTIVVEAGRKSGAKKTADFALDLNRDVAAVPGPIDAMTSYGTNKLIALGAQIITDIEDALTLAGLSRAGAIPGSAADGDPSTAGRELSNVEAVIIKALTHKHLTTEQLVIECALPVNECLVAISALEIDGFIESNLVGEFHVRPRRSRRAGALNE